VHGSFTRPFANPPKSGRSGRRRDCSRRPPTPPDGPFGIRRFRSTVQNLICGNELGFLRCVVWRCSGHHDLLRDFRPLSPPPASVSPRNFCPIRSESTRQADPTSQGNSRDLHCVYPSDLRPHLLGWYRASSFVALSPRRDRLYPKAVRRTAVLLTASFRFHLAMDTHAVRPSSPHHQGLQRTCTVKSTQEPTVATSLANYFARAYALRAMPGAPQNKGSHPAALLFCKANDRS